MRKFAENLTLMKKITPLFSFIFMVTMSGSAQRVGVNTRTPLSTLEVKSETSNPSDRNLQLKNNVGTSLVTVLNNGNMGIGTATPSTPLEVNSNAAGAVKITDGTQGEGKVFTSNATGVGTWQNAGAHNIVGSFGTGVTISRTETGYVYTGATITLPPKSKYLVNISLLMTYGNNYTVTSGSLWLRTYFSDSPAYAPSTPTQSADNVGGKFAVSGLLPPNSPFNMLTGFIILQNSNPAPKTYYLMAGGITSNGPVLDLANFAAAGWWEGNIAGFSLQ